MEIVGGFASKRGYLALQKWSCGIIFRPAMNPDGEEVPDDILDGILVAPEIPRITAECWTAMQRLFILCIEQDPRGARGTVDANNEVCVVFGYNEETKEVIVAAMPQQVGRAHVAMDRTKGAINLITGEKYKSWPPVGYAEIGDCHSHNRMGAFFSGTDNNDDKGLPGVHLVCGNYTHDKSGWDYKIASSIVANQTRYEKVLRQNQSGVLYSEKMTWEDIADIKWIEEVQLHDDVLSVVNVEYPKAVVYQMPAASSAYTPIPPTGTHYGAGGTVRYENGKAVAYWDYKKNTWVDIPHYTDKVTPVTPYQDAYDAYVEQRARELGVSVQDYKQYLNDMREVRVNALTGGRDGFDLDDDDQFKAYRDAFDKDAAAGEEEAGVNPTRKEINEFLGDMDTTSTDLPGQMTLFDQIVNEAQVAEDDNTWPWWVHYLRDCVDNIYDEFDEIGKICPDEFTKRKVLAAMLNRTDFFKGTIRPRGESRRERR